VLLTEAATQSRAKITDKTQHQIELMKTDVPFPAIILQAGQNMFLNPKLLAQAVGRRVTPEIPTGRPIPRLPVHQAVLQDALRVARPAGHHRAGRPQVVLAVQAVRGEVQEAVSKLRKII